MGYEFHRGQSLIEAVTHPSFATSASASYQCLEFLGDGKCYDTLPKVGPDLIFHSRD